MSAALAAALRRGLAPGGARWGARARAMPQKQPLILGCEARCFAAAAGFSGPPLENIRNFGISAHIDSGKTTLTERVLFYTGRIKEIHEVRGKDGVGAKMDHMELEREKGITITSAATYCSWRAQEKDHHMNLIDTPGHVDFTIEVERALRVLDGAVMICCGVGGVQSQTITVDRQMKRYEVPRIIFVNKLDRYGSDPNLVLAQVRHKLGLTVQPLQLPIGQEDSFRGLCDVVSRKAVYYEGESGLTRRIAEIPAEQVEEVEALRAKLFETLADLDDEFAEAYLEVENEVPDDKVHAAIRRATLNRTFCPMLMGSAYKNKGVQDLLDAVCRYLPSPLDRKNLAMNAENESDVLELQTDPSKPLVAYAFKIQDHPQAGQVTYMRLYQGKVSKGDQILNMMTDKRLGVKRLVRMHSNEVKDVPSAGAGDIIALAGVECESGITFTDGKQRVTCSSMYVPDAVMSLSVSANRDDQARFQRALKRFQREDPTFRVEMRQDTNETIISGMGELHLEIYCERMRREFKVESLQTGEPKVNYRESITVKTPFEYTHKRQSGGRGQYGKVIGYFEPMGDDGEGKEKDEGIEFVNRLSGNEVPPNYVPAIEKGFRKVCETGLLCGAPLGKMRVVLEDGAAHEVDSSSEAFQAAAAGAFENFYRDAGPVILEPLMSVEVTFPKEFQQACLSTVTGREGSVQGTRSISGETNLIEATVPLRRMFGYSTELRSVTQGQGEFSMEFKEYEQMPEQKAEEVISQYRKSLREKARA